MRIHELKTWPEFFSELQAGRKTFEVRLNDRDFRVGDVLALREFDHTKDAFTRKSALIRCVTYVMYGPGFGLTPDYCVMAIAHLPFVEDVAARKLLKARGES